MPIAKKRSTSKEDESALFVYLLISFWMTPKGVDPYCTLSESTLSFLSCIKEINYDPPLVSFEIIIHIFYLKKYFFLNIFINQPTGLIRSRFILKG